MRKKRFILTLFLLCLAWVCFGKTTEEPVFSNKETLFSTKTGKVIGEVLLSIAPKSAAPPIRKHCSAQRPARLSAKCC